jgi:death-on-curing family protein
MLYNMGYERTNIYLAERVYLTVGEVLQIHHAQIDNYGGAHGLRDKGLLESAVFRPLIGYYNTVAEEAAALMESLANNHPFLDGNKRVAFEGWNGRMKPLEGDDHE